MKFVHLKAVVGAMALSASLAGVAQAQVVNGSGTSDPANVELGDSTVNGGPHVSGRVGIWVPNLGTSTPQRFVDFQGLQGFVPPSAYTVTTVNNPTGTITDHSRYGRFDFARANHANLYFGEWSQTGVATAGDHTVYYAGADKTDVTTPIAAATATYSVVGINNYAANPAVLNTTGTGGATFTATFNGSNGGSLSGTLVGHQTVVLTNVGISGADFGTAFGGSASITPNGSTLRSAAVSGEFFGSNAAALAGIATVSGERNLDTAFAGHKF
ncbi:MULTISPECIES: Slam-dependent surface lipoprotein [Sphingomonadales]|jgi:hypothetical protein|uniref:Transferrin-binding protein B C-lobe/N-lobe beta barrel domain-containing protein n=2 Tax=Sphingomonadaceae TaxID=41297 RepID=A0A397P8V0_9SPHN|nr:MULTISPECIES: Slam-dependent surface lipoprotein [Sphingomonadaceae]EKU73366.1 hypothetical protein HMPREF9718_03835 [Sphingobium yanoikuyae ATCC 51230]RIA46006.1 hypothetical protein DFR49_0535 [Hephaestia caeni]WQE08149.1 Slam-dependent surface lipoprotein [Sphingobium yanoikuyae]